MPDAFGGVEVDEPQTDSFGGVAVEEQPVTAPKARPLPDKPGYKPQQFLPFGFGAYVPVTMPPPFEPILKIPEATVPEDTSGEVTLSTPEGVPMRLPRKQMAQAGAALANVAKSVPEVLTQPLGGPLSVALPESKLGEAALKGYFAAQAAKGGAAELGEASVTGDTQKGMEGVAQLLMAPHIARPVKARPAPRETPKTEAPAAVPALDPRALLTELDSQLEQLRADPAVTGRTVVGMNPDGSPKFEENIRDDAKLRRVQQLEDARKILVQHVERMAPAEAPAEPLAQAGPQELGQTSESGLVPKRWVGLTPEQLSELQQERVRQARQIKATRAFEKAESGPQELPATPAVTTPVTEAVKPTAKASVIKQNVQARVDAGIDPNNIRISVQAGQVPGDVGYVQVDEIHPELGNTFSSNPEALSKAGFDMPSSEALKQLPSGKYTLPEAVKQLSEISKKPTSEPMVTLYHTEGGPGGTGFGGSWFSSDPIYAASLGPKMTKVEVPKAVADAARQAALKQANGTPGAHILPDEWVKKSKPVKSPAMAKVFDTDLIAKAVEAQEAKAAAPAEPVRVGPGAKTSKAQAEAPETFEATGLKNAVADLERTGLGLKDAPPTVQRNMAKAWVDSANVERIRPGTGADLANRLRADPNIGLTDTESALLLRHKVDLWNKLNDAAERTHTGTPEERKLAQAEHDGLLVQFDSLLDSVKRRGEEWGREGRWRQAMSREDFTFTSRDELNRYHRALTGEDLPADKTDQADRVANQVKTASDAADKAGDVVHNFIRAKRQPTISEAEQRALDAASKAVREADVRMAQGVNKTRVADVVRQMDLLATQKAAVDKGLMDAVKNARDAAVKLADAENAERVATAERAKKLAQVQVKAAQKALDRASKTIRDATIRRVKEEARRRADPTIAVWEKAKSLLDSGMEDFDDLRHKIATDLGLSVDEVTRLLSKDKSFKRLTNEMWNKQQQARRLKEQAKRFVAGVNEPAYKRAIARIPRLMFSLKVGLHGTVALGTHAPMVAFQPRFWNAYVRNFGKMYKMVFSPAYYEMQMQNLKRRPNYITAQRAGLVNDPFQYEEYHTTAIQNLVRNWLGNKAELVDKFTSSGNRGYSVLKLLRQDMFDQQWNRMPKEAQIPEVAQAVADGVNHATGVVKGKAPPGTHLALFAPRLEASRVAWLAVDPAKAVDTFANWKKASVADKTFAMNQLKEKAWVFGTFASLLALNQGFLTASKSKQKINGIPTSLGGAGINPMEGDFMKFKAAGFDVAYGSAMLNMAKLPMRLATSIMFSGKTSKLILEDERVYKIAGDYIRSQMSPIAGTATDLALGRDYAGRPLPRKGFGMLAGDTDIPKRLRLHGVTQPYTWPEYSSQVLTPIPIEEGIREVWGQGLGMSDKQIQHYLRAWAIISLMAGTGTRVTDDYKTNK